MVQAAVSKLDSALALAARGFKVFPVKEGAKFPPLISGWKEKATSDSEQVRLFWLATPNANIGIHCDGLCVIDVDIKKGGNNALELLRMVEDLPDTLTADTPTGGRHLFYRLPDGHEGVPNSVETLGKGLDVRSRGGYVVGAGSTVEAGEYRFASGGEGADIRSLAPDWLVDRLGASVQRELPAVQDIPPASDEVVARAMDWLETAERSVKGAGGDQAAYRVACRLRDFGLSYLQACEAMRSDAWDQGCGWREGRLEDKPIRSAYRYATGEPGGKIAVADDFPLVEYVEQAPRQQGGLLTLADFAGQSDRSMGYVLKGMLQRGSYAEVFGAPGEGKTFVALDIAYNIAAGTPWMGRKVHGGPVLYLPYEGRGGLVNRAKALRQRYGDAQVPLYFGHAPFNIREAAGRRDLGALMAQMPAKPVMIVFDTFAKALMGGDENSAQDVGSFNNAIEALIANTGACVVIVHHSGKDKSKGARGSSALLGALDTEIEIDSGQVIARKQRDIELGEPVGFKLVPMVIGQDQDGDDLTSCVVDAHAAPAAQGLPRLAGNARRGFEVLCSLRPDNAPITSREWQDNCVEFLGQKAIAQRFYDIKRQLLAKGYIVVENDLITRRME